MNDVRWLVSWTRPRLSTTKIVIHARKTPETAPEMDSWFRRRGFLQCGFHYCVSRSVTTETRDPKTIGAHVSEHDKDSLGICVLGWSGQESETLDPSTKENLRLLIAKLVPQYPQALLQSAPELMNLSKGYDALHSLVEELNLYGRELQNKL